MKPIDWKKKVKTNDGEKSTKKKIESTRPIIERNRSRNIQKRVPEENQVVEGIDFSCKPPLREQKSPIYTSEDILEWETRREYKRKYLVIPSPFCHEEWSLDDYLPTKSESALVFDFYGSKSDKRLLQDWPFICGEESEIKTPTQKENLKEGNQDSSLWFECTRKDLESLFNRSKRLQYHLFLSAKSELCFEKRLTIELNIIKERFFEKK